MDQATPTLDPSELYDKRRSKDAARLKAYNNILGQIYNRVRVISKLNNSPCQLIYPIPPFILGLPKIDATDCAVYLIHQLRHAKYETRYTPPNLLFISWAHHEKAYFIEQCPIMGAMMESAEKTRADLDRKEREASRLIQGKKSQKKVRMATPGEFADTRAPLGQFQPFRSQPLKPVVSAGPAPPSASEYVPPSAFLQTITQPTHQSAQPKSVSDYFR